MAGLRYAPQFRVTIDDKLVPSTLRASISSVSLETGLEGADRVELALVNENLRWLDQDLLKMDHTLKLELGYAPDPLTQVFVGEITGQAASFPSSGAPTLTVTAQDRRQRLQEGTKVRWFGMSIPIIGNFPLAPDVGIVPGIVAEAGLIPLIEPVAAAIAMVLGGIEAISTVSDPSEAQKFIREQAGESDFDLLTRIAKENGWEMLIDHTGPHGGMRLVFMSPLDHLQADLDSGRVIRLHYGSSLVEFTPRISKVGQIASVTAFVWVAKIKTKISVTLGWDWDRMKPTLDFGAGSAPSGGSESAVVINESLSLSSAPRKLVSELIPKLNKRLTGSGSTVGDPRIQAGKVLQLEGLGTQFGGLYRVTSASHTIDSSGYHTRFEVRKEIWFGSIPLREQGAVPVQVQSPFVQ